MRSLLLFLLALIVTSPASAQATFTNPILKGGFPDPSICRVDDTYYLVNSSFEYFPGLPIHRSSDLVNWELIGYGLHREAQVTGAVNLVDVQSNGGIHAPTLRCRDDRFYLITTNVYLPPGEDAETEFVNFIVTAEDPAGPWSDPLVIAGAPGIDPDLFFDEDGTVWYLGTHSPANPNFPGEGEIWLQQLDPDSFQLTGPRHLLWRGACGGVWAEGPHLYQRDGRYYLVIAEGGTSFNHAVMVAVGDRITGPYEPNPRNPILSSRHLSYDHWVNSTGHADLFELPDGRTYLVTLGIRGDEQRRSNMGRETHLVPVRWEREPFEWKEVRHEWPVAAPDTGRVERRLPVPIEGTRQFRADNFDDRFDVGPLGLAWNFRRVPKAGTLSLAARPGFLRLQALPEVVRERGRAALVGFRQTESDFSYTTRMSFSPGVDGAEAGMNLFQKDNDHVAFTVLRKGDSHFLRIISSQPERQAQVLASAPLEDYGGDIILRVESRAGRYTYRYSIDSGQTMQELTRSGADLILSEGYTGAYLGLYATSNGRSTSAYADFDWVSYRGFPRP